MELWRCWLQFKISLTVAPRSPPYQELYFKHAELVWHLAEIFFLKRNRTNRASGLIVLALVEWIQRHWLGLSVCSGVHVLHLPLLVWSLVVTASHPCQILSPQVFSNSERLSFAGTCRGMLQM